MGIEDLLGQIISVSKCALSERKAILGLRETTPSSWGTRAMGCGGQSST